MSNQSSPIALWLAPLPGVAIVMLILLAPIGLGPTAFLSAAENACHGPLFAVVAVGLLLWLRRLNRPVSILNRYLLAMLLAVGLGAAGEIAQSFTATRDAEWIDLFNDLLGATAGLSLYALYDQRPLRAITRYGLCLVAMVALLLVAAPVAQVSFMYWQRWQQLPALVTWESPRGHYFVMSDSAELKVMASPICEGAAVAMQVNPIGTGRWVGMTIEEPWPDWSSYAQLAIEVANPNDKPLELLMRVNDGAHNNDFDDRFNRGFVVAAREHATLHVPLSEVQAAPKTRSLDLKNVTRLVLFQDALRGAQVLQVCGVRLLR